MNIVRLLGGIKMRFKFGSFNVMNMSWATTDDKKRFIADLIRKEQFDVVAFQEVLL